MESVKKLYSRSHGVQKPMITMPSISCSTIVYLGFTAFSLACFFLNFSSFNRVIVVPDHMINHAGNYDPAAPAAIGELSAATRNLHDPQHRHHHHRHPANHQEPDQETLVTRSDDNYKRSDHSITVNGQGKARISDHSLQVLEQQRRQDHLMSKLAPLMAPVLIGNKIPAVVRKNNYHHRYSADQMDKIRRIISNGDDGGDGGDDGDASDGDSDSDDGDHETRHGSFYDLQDKDQDSRPSLQQHQNATPAERNKYSADQIDKIKRIISDRSDDEEEEEEEEDDDAGDVDDNGSQHGITDDQEKDRDLSLQHHHQHQNQLQDQQMDQIKHILSDQSDHDDGDDANGDDGDDPNHNLTVAEKITPPKHPYTMNGTADDDDDNDDADNDVDDGAEDDDPNHNLTVAAKISGPKHHYIMNGTADDDNDEDHRINHDDQNANNNDAGQEIIVLPSANTSDLPHNHTKFANYNNYSTLNDVDDNSNYTNYNHKYNISDGVDTNHEDISKLTSNENSENDSVINDHSNNHNHSDDHNADNTNSSSSSSSSNTYNTTNNPNYYYTSDNENNNATEYSGKNDYNYNYSSNPTPNYNANNNDSNGNGSDTNYNDNYKHNSTNYGGNDNNGNNDAGNDNQNNYGDSNDLKVEGNDGISQHNLQCSSIHSEYYGRFMNATTSPGGCDLRTGTWVRDEEEEEESAAAPYSTHSCGFIHGNQDCEKNGRPDTEYLRWRWRPRGCRLPRFDAALFLRLMRGRRMLFVGDSLARNHFESLFCTLSQVERVEIGAWWEHMEVLNYTFPSYNFTLGAVWSPFLARREKAAEGEGGSKLGGDGPGKLHVDEMEELWAALLPSYDVVVVSGAYWFYRDNSYYAGGRNVTAELAAGRGLGRGRDRDLDRVVGVDPGLDLDPGVGVGVDLDRGLDRAGAAVAGMRLVWRNLFRFFLASGRFRGTLVLRTLSVSHFESSSWDKGGTCNRTQPDLSFVDPDRMNLDWQHDTAYRVQISAFHRALALQKKMMMMSTKVPAAAAAAAAHVQLRLLDVTYSTIMRVDGHPGRYRIQSGGASEWRNDCLHWCLPGPIDTWNQLLLADSRIMCGAAAAPATAA